MMVEATNRSHSISGVNKKSKKKEEEASRKHVDKIVL